MSPFKLGVLMAASYLLQAVNLRAIAFEQYIWIAVTDFAIAFLTFKLIKKVAEAESDWAVWAYAIGGTIGALGGVWLSRNWS